MENYKTISQFTDHQNLFSKASLRHHISHGKENGLEECGAVFRVGRKVIINVEKFNSWVGRGGRA